MTATQPTSPTPVSGSLARERIYYAQNRAYVDNLISQGNPIPRPEMGRYNPHQPATGRGAFFREMVSPYSRSSTQLRTMRWMGGGNLAIDVFTGRAGFNLDTLFNIGALLSGFIPGLAIVAGAWFASKALGNFCSAVGSLFRGNFTGCLMNIGAGVINAICALPIGKLFKFGPKLLNACKGADGAMNWSKLGYLGSKMCYGSEATNSFTSGVSWLKNFGKSSNKGQMAQGAAEGTRDAIWKFLDWLMAGKGAARAGTPQFTNGGGI